jgi:hypothetical protein
MLLDTGGRFIQFQFVPVSIVRLCIECADLFCIIVSMVFSKDIFSATYMEYIKGFVPIRYRGYCLCISPHPILLAAHDITYLLTVKDTNSA